MNAQPSLFSSLTESSYLRPYQQLAVEAALSALADGLNPVIALPTGAGKSRCLASICQAIPGRILVATHRKELLEQDSEELALILDGDHGIYSAGLSRRDTHARIIFGGVQSIYRRMEELQAAGPFELIIVDEAHLVGMRGKEGIMYPQVFAACSGAQRVGLSATPFRLDDGPIWGDGPDTYFDTLACDIGIRELTPQYLAPLRGILTAHDIDLTGVRTAAGEYVLSDMSQVACEDSVVTGALDELCTLARNRRRWLVFCIDIAHTELVTERLRARGINAGMIVGPTGDDDRTETLAKFKAGELRALVNCLVATTGFNIPSIDVVAMLRPTQSKSLVIQCIGRGSRKSPGKEDCLILDFAGNIERHQPLDGALFDIERSPERQVKDEAEEKKRKAARKAREISHNKKASLLDPFGEGQREERPAQRVLSVYYDLSPSSKYAGKQNVKVAYRLEGSPKWAYSWICPEYSGGARWHAEQWFKRRGLRCPESAGEALEILKRGRRPEAIVTRQEGKYVHVVLEQFEEKASDLWE